MWERERGGGGWGMMQREANVLNFQSSDSPKIGHYKGERHVRGANRGKGKTRERGQGDAYPVYA